ncbi:MAG: hypothetical protein WAQ52_10490 [Terriglobales bacterium]
MIFRRGAAAAAIVLILGSASALAQSRIQFVEYSAKFLCGVVEEKGPGAAPVRPGIYETSINIHDPQLPLSPLPSVTFVKKVVLAPREGEEPVRPSGFRRDVLQADFAEHVDCKVIRSMLGPAGGAAFVEGYVVLIVLPSPITVPHELDVVGVYTVTNQQGQSIALEMLPIAPRVLPFPVAAGAKLRDKMLEESKKE